MIAVAARVVLALAVCSAAATGAGIAPDPPRAAPREPPHEPLRDPWRTPVRAAAQVAASRGRGAGAVEPVRLLLAGERTRRALRLPVGHDGEPGELVVAIVNGGDATLLLTAATVTGPGASLTLSEPLPVLLAAGGEVAALLGFAQPVPPGGHGQIELVGNDLAGGTRALLVDLLAREPEPVPSAWTSGPAMPVALGEVAAGVIDGVLYVIGEGSPRTVAYDIAAGTWDDTLAHRPHVGHHHAAEVLDGKLHVVGGLNGGSPGRLQIYDPASNTWSEASPLPWAGGSLSTAVIDGKLYASGGIVGGTTVSNTGVWDPSTDTWTSLAPVPLTQGRNHAAGGTDGTRFFIFGGRGIGSGVCNCLANGFDSVHVYDPATDTWESTELPGSTLAPLPQYRGGMGRAIWHGGEFYVFGGETKDGPGATPDDVYDRVDVYDPLTNTWRLELPMPTARHGIYPVAHGGDIYVAAGGVESGNSQSALLEIFTPGS